MKRLLLTLAIFTIAVTAEFAAKPIQQLTVITANFSGITFDDTNFQFGDANRIYTITETPRVPHQWREAFYYNLTTPPAGPYNAYAKIYVAVVSGEVQEAFYLLFSDLSPLDEYGRKIPLELFYVDNLLYSGDSSLGATLPNLEQYGGTLVVSLIP